MEIDPDALPAYAKTVRSHAEQIARLAPKLSLSADTLGSFDEGTSLMQALNHQINDVYDRVTAAANVLRDLADVADLAAGMAQESDAKIATDMKAINDKLTFAEQTLNGEVSSLAQSLIAAVSVIESAGVGVLTGGSGPR